jgi:hypothetical protein
MIQVYAFKIRSKDLRIWFLRSRFRAKGLRFRVSGLGFRI